MSDQSGTGPLPELTPPQEQEVRRLLAQARHLEPIPADVGARLDRVLSDLSLAETGPGDTEPTPPVIDLAARRRRRNASALLAAAAAVIVAGFGIGQVIDVGSSDTADTAGSAADSNANRESVNGDDQAKGDAGGGNDLQAAPEAAELPLRLSSTNLKRDVEGQLTRLRSYAAASQDGPSSLAHLEEAYDCVPSPTTAYGPGDLYPALFDGSPSVLALRPITGDHQVVEVLQCGSGAALAMVTVDAP